ncbi:MAG: MerR family transcriptional regulator [Polaromonas sp.]
MFEAKPLRLIGQAAALSGVSAASIRFYEKEGLLAPGQRLASGYRGYSDGEIHQLRFIRLCRAMDMSLDEVRTLLHLNLAEKADCAAANATLESHLKHVGERLAELRALQRNLRELRERCDGSGPQCRIMEALHQRAGEQPPGEPMSRGHRHV